jgi:hypothetical protein
MRTPKDLSTGYLGDLLAAQNHLFKIVDQQVGDLQVTTHVDVRDLLTQLHIILRRHTDSLEERLRAFGGCLSADVKEALTAATGLAAGLLGKIRPHMASKSLRDDYILLSACSIGYEMLHATALALRDKETADLALQHFKDITPLVVRLSELMPSVVVHELTHDVAGIDAGAIPIARENTRQAWSNETVHPG